MLHVELAHKALLKRLRQSAYADRTTPETVHVATDRVKILESDGGVKYFVAIGVAERPTDRRMRELCRDFPRVHAKLKSLYDEDRELELAWMIKLHDFMELDLQRDVKDKQMYVMNGLPLPNPHILYYTCNGQARQEIEKAIGMGLLDKALLAAVHMAGQVTWTDDSVMRRWNDDLPRQNAQGSALDMTPEETAQRVLDDATRIRLAEALRAINAHRRVSYTTANTPMP